MLRQKGHCNVCKVSKDQKSPTQHVQELSSLNFEVDEALRMMGTEEVLTFWDYMKSSKFVLILQYWIHAYFVYIVSILALSAD